MKIKLIVACDNEWNIGKDGNLPWTHIKEDMNIFSSNTTSGTNPGVLMGRKTWDSLPSRHRPLSNRINIVLSRSLTELDGAHVINTVKDIVKYTDIDTLWIIGGYSVYKEFIGIASELFISRIDDVFDGCDVMFPHENIEQFYVKNTEKRYEGSKYNFTLENWGLKSINKI